MAREFILSETFFKRSTKFQFDFPIEFDGWVTAEGKEDPPTFGLSICARSYPKDPFSKGKEEDVAIRMISLEVAKQLRDLLNQQIEKAETKWAELKANNPEQDEPKAVILKLRP